MMNDSSTRLSLARRLVLVTAALCVMGALALVPSAAAADPTPFSAENFNPDTSGAAGPASAGTSLDNETSVMSDLFEGGNSLFHATTVTTTNATQVQYYFCPVAFAGAGDLQVDPGDDVAAEDPTQAGSGCEAAGAADTTGVTPSGVNVGEAYEAEIDIPSDLDGATVDFVAWVCSGTTTTAADCDAEVEPTVQVDDASQAPSTTSGEITAPAHPANPSNQGFTASARTSPDVTAVTFCLAMLDGTPPAPFAPADENGDPSQCVTDPDFDAAASNPAIKTDTTPNTTTASHKTWSVAFTDAETPNNTEMALVLFEGTGTDGEAGVPQPPAESGIGLCKDPSTGTPGATDCQLDSHYIVTSAVAPATAKIAFPDQGDDATLPNDCTETAATTASEAEPEQYVRVQGCILDQSGNNVTDGRQWAFQITPVDPAGTTDDETGFECSDPGAGKTCSDTSFPDAAPAGGAEHQVDIAPGVGWPNYECEEREPGPDLPPGAGCPTGEAGADGVQRDLNGDFFYESADGEPSGTAAGTPGIADEVMEFHTGGTYTITFCFDSNNDAATSPTPCAGEAVSATGTSFNRATVDHVHAKRQGTDGQCHSGEVFTTAPAASSVNLQGCALALLGTAESPAPGAQVAWILNPGAPPGSPGAIQNAQTFTDSNGQATAQVTSDKAAGGKSTTVRFCLDEHPASTTAAPNGNGVCDSAEAASGALAKTHADFRIDWTAVDDPSPGGQCSASRENSGQNEILIGSNGGDSICGFGGNDTLRGLGGPDTLKGGTGNDVMAGGSGPDRLRGSGGNDKLKGGPSNDSLKGQGGRDTGRGGSGDDRCSTEKENSCER
jgi:RTX calcium-binding nonapeptide repeat (4 copies)